jgi:hypothetical protein
MQTDTNKIVLDLRVIAGAACSQPTLPSYKSRKNTKQFGKKSKYATLLIFNKRGWGLPQEITTASPLLNVGAGQTKLTSTIQFTTRLQKLLNKIDGKEKNTETHR